MIHPTHPLAPPMIMSISKCGYRAEQVSQPHTLTTMSISKCGYRAEQNSQPRTLTTEQSVSKKETFRQV
jgi:hypothetical protein